VQGNPATPTNDFGNRNRHKALTPFLDRLEESRRKNLAQYEHRMRACMVLGIGLVWLYLQPLPATAEPLLVFIAENRKFFLLAGLLLLGDMVYSPLRNYQKAYKKVILPEMMQTFAGLNYRPDKTILPKRILPSGLIDKKLTYVSDEYFWGGRHNILVEFAAVKMVDRIGRDPLTKKRPHNVFKGFYVTYQLPKGVVGHTFITMKNGTMNQKMHRIRNELHNVNLNDATLEHFNIYTSDFKQAQQVISKPFLAKLTALSKLFGNSEIECSIYNNFVFITAPFVKEIFKDPDIHHPAFSSEDIPFLQDATQQILEVVDTLPA